MNLDDYGYFDGGVFIFHPEPFAFISDEGVTLVRELDYRRMRDRFHVDLERLVSDVLKKQIGIPDPLRQRKPHQKPPQQSPGE